MRLIDADFAIEKIKKSDMTNREKIALLLMLSKIPTLAPLPNDPLTMDELREMDGEPVWLEVTGADGHYVMLYGFECEIGGFSFYREISRKVEDYGRTWLAYRRKPEEETHGMDWYKRPTPKS